MSEPMAPWLIAACVLAVLNLTIVARGHQLPVLEQTILLIGLGATLAAGGLVSARSNRALRVSVREERARPASEELAGAPVDMSSASYLEGMERWTAGMLELIEHAADLAAPSSPVHGELAAAAAETRDLRTLLDVDSVDDLSINDKALIHALSSLWEANQPRIEKLAEELDPAWHRRWSARSVADRRLRHGITGASPLVLPYRS